jgi:hypothetical protein
MRKTLTIIAGISLLFTACSKSGGGGGTKPTSSIVHFMRIKHNGNTIYAADTAYYSYTGVLVPRTTISGSVLLTSNNQLLVTVYSPKAELEFGGYKSAGIATGNYFRSDISTGFFYTDASGKRYSSVLKQATINLTQVDDSNIIGTATLMLKDSSFAELEFNAKPQY